MKLKCSINSSVSSLNLNTNNKNLMMKKIKKIRLSLNKQKISKLGLQKIVGGRGPATTSCISCHDTCGEQEPADPPKH